MHFIDVNNCDAMPWRALMYDPDYGAAKNHEDSTAALRLVRRILDRPENAAQMRSLKNKFPGAILVPIHAEEAGGRNRLPAALAAYLAKRTGLEVDTAIVQSTRAFHTGSSVWYRFASRPEFSGKVQAGRSCILLDDVCAMGGSLNELRLHIERNGGRVVQAACLALGGYGDELALRPDTLKKLLDKYTEKKLSSFLTEVHLYDGNFNCLTEPEARALGAALSLDAARDRILEAGQAGLHQTHGGYPQGRDALRPAPPRSFRR
jgi:hypothetical protein